MTVNPTVCSYCVFSSITAAHCAVAVVPYSVLSRTVICVTVRFCNYT